MQPIGLKKLEKKLKMYTALTVYETEKRVQG